MTRTRIAVIAAAAVATLALTGCGKVDGDAIDAEFAGRPGVVGTRTSCSEDLPFAYNCTVTVHVARDITAPQLIALLPSMRTGLRGARGTIAVPRELGEPTLEIQFDDEGRLAPDLPDDAVARAFVAGIADPQVNTFVMTWFAPARTAPAVEIGYADPGDQPGARSAQHDAAVALIRDIQQILPTASVEADAVGLTVHAPDGSAPQDELALFLDLSAIFPVAHGRVEPGVLHIRLDGEMLASAVEAFVAADPRYASIDFVAIDSDGSLDARNVDPAVAADLDAVVRAAQRAMRGLTTAVAHDRVTFTVPAPEAAGVLDAALAELPEYARVAVTYRAPGMEVDRRPGNELPIDQALALAGDPAVADVSITQNPLQNDGHHIVDVGVAPGTAPYDLGVTLAGAGIDRIPGTWVVAALWGDDGWTVTFRPDDVRVEPGPWLTAEQAAEFTRGWQDGR